MMTTDQLLYTSLYGYWRP